MYASTPIYSGIERKKLNEKKIKRNDKEYTTTNTLINFKSLNKKLNSDRQKNYTTLKVNGNKFKTEQMTENLKRLASMKNDLSLWISDADFWIDEVNNCQTILEQKIALIDEIPERKHLDQFQNQIIYYRDELLPLFKHDLLEQKEKLKDNADISSLTESHNSLEERGNGIAVQMKERRRQLEMFVNNI